MDERDRIFEEEQRHLTETYAFLRTKEQSVADELRTLYEKARQEKADISEDLALNFHDAEEALESNMELELVNRVVDEFNIENATLTRQSRQLLTLLEQPYFARVQVHFPEEEETEDFYIGTAQLTGDSYEPVIVDWRSPIAEVYYNQQNGRTAYHVDGRPIEVDLLLRRQFDITRDRLNACFDTQIAIEDPMLLKSLSRRRSDKMQSITATIQREQNEVIRHPDEPVMLIEGTAGSGKTSVLLQRIAYLLYQKRASVRASDVYLITLNPVFENYIANVLPDLGEENPNTLTWSAFLSEAGFRAREFQDNTEPDSLDLIDRELEGFELIPTDFRGISVKGRKALPAKSIDAIYRRNRKLGTGARLIGVMEDQMVEEAEQYIRQHRNDRRGSYEELYEDTDEEAFLKEERRPDEEENGEKNDFNSASQAVRSHGWLDVPAIGRRLLGKTYLTDAERAYLYIRLTGTCSRSAKYVMIDEVQDYTEAQIRVFRAYFPQARFLMLGDEYQAIRGGTVTFERIRELFSENTPAWRGKPVTTMKLMTSYRSSPEITALFTSLLPARVGTEVQSVQRPGIRPVIRSCPDRASYLEALRGAIRDAEESGLLTAVIVNGRSAQDRLHSLLGSDAPHYIRASEAIPEHGVCMVTLALSKGLEFDAVIIPDADGGTYPDTQLKRHQLYTAVSRATERITLLAEGPLSPLLDRFTDS